MALKSSTGLKNSILATGSFRSVLGGGVIKLYGGPVPADADAVASSDLLCTISLNDTGAGLSFEASATGGVITKSAGEVWKGTTVLTGIATHYRFVASGDTGAASTSEPRLQGTVGMAGADLNLSNTSLISGAVQTIDYYAATLL